MARRQTTKGRRLILGAFAAGAWVAGGAAVSAETLQGALAKAYYQSPTINAQRSGVRAVDENVPRALSGYRPRISASADIGADYSEYTNNGQTNTVATAPRGVGLQLDQTIWDGNRRFNSVRQAESQVFGARYSLDATVQDTLFAAAQVYMDVLRDTAILNLRKNNVEVLDEQLRQTRDRFNVGEVTRTDVAQAEARLALARSEVSAAEGDLRASIANYRRIVGTEPRQLAPGRPLDRLLPGTLDVAVRIALAENPNITSAQHALDAAELQVKIVEGELYPTIGVSASLNHRYDNQVSGDRTNSAQVVARMTVPIYQGGEVSARVRQAKETASQRRFEVEVTRDQVRAITIAAWGQLESARARIVAAEAQVQAAETALTGVREEARVGQRTTLDVLNAQQELLSARVSLVDAQRDRVVASYRVVQSLGRLTPERLALKVERYDPKVHFEQVRGLLWGTSTPSGD